MVAKINGVIEVVGGLPTNIIILIIILVIFSYLLIFNSLQLLVKLFVGVWQRWVLGKHILLFVELLAGHTRSNLVVVLEERVTI